MRQGEAEGGNIARAENRRGDACEMILISAQRREAGRDRQEIHRNQTRHQQGVETNPTTDYYQRDCSLSFSRTLQTPSFGPTAVGAKQAPFSATSNQSADYTLTSLIGRSSRPLRPVQAGLVELKLVASSLRCCENARRGDLRRPISDACHDEARERDSILLAADGSGPMIPVPSSVGKCACHDDFNSGSAGRKSRWDADD